MRYLVLGAGAIGGYFGAMLLQGGADLSFLVRPKRAAQLAEQGLIVKAPDGNIEVPGQDDAVRRSRRSLRCRVARLQGVRPRQRHGGDRARSRKRQFILPF